MQSEFALESFDSIYSRWQEIQGNSATSVIFSSPHWSRAWWQQFGHGTRLFLGAVKCQGRVIGIAPLVVKDDVASFIGGIDVCDYLDFVVEPGTEGVFFQLLLDSLVRAGILQLDLAPLRPDSTVVTRMTDIARKQGWQVVCSKEDVAVEVDLPATWGEYLQMLTGKQRHELRRKLRRLGEEGELTHRVSTEANQKDIDTFLKLFRDSRQDKATFLTPKMESFFRAIAGLLAKQGLLRLNILELNATPVAATMCFDYQEIVYLYNSGYNPSYGWLSVGLLSKALCIKDSIERRRKRFDFLKGGEAYKYHIGGHDVPLYRCQLRYAT